MRKRLDQGTRAGKGILDVSVTQGHRVMMWLGGMMNDLAEAVKIGSIDKRTNLKNYKRCKLKRHNKHDMSKGGFLRCDLPEGRH
jgi:hypothetical protein